MKRAARDTMEYRIGVLAFIVVASAVSAFTFLRSGLGEKLNLVLTDMMSLMGIGASGSVFIVFLLCLTVLAAMANEKRTKWPLSFSWVLYIPSAMHYSQIDWIRLIGASADSLTENPLPEAFILLNGILLICASLLLRSYKNVSEIRDNLLERGGDRKEVNAVCAKNMKFLVPLILGPAVLAAAVWFVTKLMPLKSGEFIGSEMHLWVSLLCGVVLLAVFVSAFVGREKTGKTGTDEERTDPEQS